MNGLRYAKDREFPDWIEVFNPGPGARFSFTGAAGRSHAVQANAALTPAGWTNVFTLTAPGTAQSAGWLDTNAGAQRFYRLVTPVPKP